VDRLPEYVPLEQVQVLLEHTGHYHRLLEQYLLDAAAVDEYVLTIKQTPRIHRQSSAVFSFVEFHQPDGARAGAATISPRTACCETVRIGMTSAF
jgi:hypothetical protein